MSDGLDSRRLGDRLTNVELLFTHLERQLGELNQVVLEQAVQLAALQKQIRLLESPPNNADEHSLDDE